ncbi:MAG TPA: hypothetical protein VES66_02550 [Terriglobales bacterium]|nr:hypothetical protein [Terriglobales bacterium]
MPTVRGNTRSCISLLLYRRATYGLRTLAPALLLVSLFCTSLYAQTATDTSSGASGVRAMHVLGLSGVKRNVHGTLTAQASGLNFAAKGAHGTVPIASIQDIFTGQDSRQVGGKVLTVAKIGVPYGGGRVLSLFSHEKVDSLTLEYRDANGALHGTVFSMPLGQAAVLKKQLVALGAHVSIPVESAPEKKEAGGNKQ